MFSFFLSVGDPRKLLEFADCALTYAMRQRPLLLSSTHDEQQQQSSSSSSSTSSMMMTYDRLPLVNIQDVLYVMEKFTSPARKLTVNQMEMMVALIRLDYDYKAADDKNKVITSVIVSDALSLLFKEMMDDYNLPSLDLITFNLDMIADGSNLLRLITSTAGQKRKRHSSRYSYEEQLPAYVMIAGLTAQEMLKGLPKHLPFLRRKLQDHLAITETAR